MTIGAMSNRRRRRIVVVVVLVVMVCRWPRKIGRHHPWIVWQVAVVVVVMTMMMMERRILLRLQLFLSRSVRRISMGHIQLLVNVDNTNNVRTVCKGFAL